MTYLNRREVDELGILALAIGGLKTIAENPKFKHAAADLKRAKTFGLKALEAIYDRLEHGDRKSFERIRDHHKVIMVPRSQLQHDQVAVDLGALETLAEYAIGKECSDCTRKDWKTCGLREALMATGIPAANDAKRKECQYRQ